MSDFIKMEILWRSIHKVQPEDGIAVVIGGIDCVDIGYLVKAESGGMVWQLSSRKDIEYASLEKFPYWTVVPSPKNMSDEFPLDSHLHTGYLVRNKADI